MRLRGPGCLLGLALLGAAPAQAVPAFPGGYGQGFAVIADIEWTGPSLEPYREHGLKMKIARLDGQSREGTVGAVRERYLRALKEAGWVVPADPKIDTLDRYEDTFFRKHEGKLQVVELLIFGQKDLNYLVVKAWPDRTPATATDFSALPAWRLPKGYGEGFPIYPLAEMTKVEVETVEDKAMGIKPYSLGRVEAIIPNVDIPTIRDWYVGRLKEDKWPVPQMFNQDDDDKFEQPFARRRDKVRMNVQMILEQKKDTDPIKLTLRGQLNEAVNLDDETAKVLEDQQEAQKATKDPVKLIVDIDPNDPDIDFLELPRGFGAGLPIPPDLQFIMAKVRNNEEIGQKWRDATIKGVLMNQTVTQAREWVLSEAEKAGYEVPGIHEEDEPHILLTRVKRLTGNFSQSIQIKIFERAEDGLTQLSIIAQEDNDVGGADAENPETMMQMPQ